MRDPGQTAAAGSISTLTAASLILPREADDVEQALWALLGHSLEKAAYRPRAYAPVDFDPIVDSWSGAVDGHEARSAAEPPEADGVLDGEADQDRQIALLEEACGEAAGWPSAIGLSVTISPALLRAPGYRDIVRATLAAADLEPARLELTVRDLESAVACRAVAPLLAGLRATGVRIALADFGTASANLACLGQMPLDRLHIAPALVAAIDTDPAGRSIVRAIIELAAELGIGVLGRGVTTANQLRFLRTNGCRHVQGSLLARPVRARAMRAA